MGKSQRDKGQRGERMLADLFNAHGLPAYRTGQTNGAMAPDIEAPAGLHVECKFVERLNIRESMCQSERDCRPGEIPIVCHKTSRKEWLTTMRTEDFLELWKASRQ